MRALRADVLFRYAQQLREILVGEAVLLRLHEHVVRQETTLVEKNLLFLFHQLAHLIYEVPLHAGEAEDLVVRRALPERLVHLEVAL